MNEPFASGEDAAPAGDCQRENGGGKQVCASILAPARGGKRPKTVRTLSAKTANMLAWPARSGQALPPERWPRLGRPEEPPLLLLW